MNRNVDRFVDMYQSLNSENLSLLKSVYDDNIIFKDPLHTVCGISNLETYFSHLYENVNEISFDIKNAYSIEDVAFVYWKMNYKHPKLNKGSIISVDGHSLLKFKDSKILTHTDYFDVGALLYRHLPILKAVIKLVDNKAANK